MRLSHSKEAVELALDTLRKNKLRSALTILGISIGISTVILISSAINGLNTNIGDFIRALGTNDLWIYHFEAFARRPTTEELNRKKLTFEDGMALRPLPHVVAVDTELVSQNFQTGMGNVSLKHGTHSIQNTVLIGATSAFKETRDLNLLEGRMWTDPEEIRSAKVVVLGHDAAEDLFPNESPLGQDVECGGGIFTVIGVYDLQPRPFGSGRNPQDNSAFFPLETFRKLHPEILDYRIVVKYDVQANKSKRSGRCFACAARSALTRTITLPSLVLMRSRNCGTRSLADCSSSWFPSPP
jgi:putative ABC transport system permease protein